MFEDAFTQSQTNNWVDDFKNDIEEVQGPPNVLKGRPIVTGDVVEDLMR